MEPEPGDHQEFDGVVVVATFSALAVESVVLSLGKSIEVRLWGPEKHE
jgi:hypothetical protein